MTMRSSASASPDLLAGTDIEIVAQAANGKDCLKLAEKHKPDVVLLDVRMPDGDGLETLEKLRQKVPNSKVVMLSTLRHSHLHRPRGGPGRQRLSCSRARREKPSSTRSWRRQQVSRRPMPGNFTAWPRTMSSRQLLDDDQVQLTRRETQVLRHLALGLSNKEIGRSLGISVETVKEHVQNVLRKLAVKDRTQAAVWAVRKGLV